MDGGFLQGFFPYKINKVFGSDSDYTDRVNYVVTSFILVILALLMGSRLYFMKTIGCWCPTEFTQTQVEYTDSTCWSTGLYYMNLSDESYPKQGTENRRLWINYAQWIPLLFIFQAALFYAPVLFWRIWSRQSGIGVYNIMQVACGAEVEYDSETRSRTIDYAAEYISEALTAQRKRGSGMFCKIVEGIFKYLPLCCGKRFGNYLVFLYMLTKVFYLLHIVGELVLINRFLGTSYTFFGAQLLYELASGGNWTSTQLFPRIAICDFEIRRLGNINRYTVQCVLPVNMFAEKIFIILWFWIIIVGLITLFSMGNWIWKLILRRNRAIFILKYVFMLKEYRCLHQRDRKKVKKLANDFLDKHLSFDGVFLIALIACNAGELTAIRITQALWKKFKDEFEQENPEAFAFTGVGSGKNGMIGENENRSGASSSL